MLDPIRTGQASPGVYRLPGHSPVDQALATVAAWGWRAFHLDGRRIVDKPSFLSVAGAALAFPTYYGHNWDAFEEMVCDLAWVPAAGYVLLYTDAYRFAGARPAEWRIALAILYHAAEAWDEVDVPFYVLIANNWYWPGPATARPPLLDATPPA